MSKKTLILAIVLVALVALGFAYQGPIKSWQNNLGKPKNILSGLDTTKINKIEFTKAKKTTILENKNNQWVVVGSDNKDFPADITETEKFLKDLGDAAKKDLELVSSNKDRQSDFETNENLGVKIKLSVDNNRTIEFIIGKMGNDFSSSYLAKINSPETYLVSLNLRESADVPEWRDLAIFTSDKTAIKKLRLQYPGREIDLEKTDKGWSATKPKKMAVNNDKVDKILTIMSTLRADEIPEQTFKGTGLEKNLIIAQASGDNLDNTLMIGDKAKGKELYFAKKGDSDRIYLISKASRDELFKKIEDLK
jgi:hypothetical protein